MLPDKYNSWLVKKLVAINPSDVSEYMNKTKDELYHLDRHIFEIDEVVPFADHEILHLSIHASILALEDWVDEFKNSQWNQFYFTSPELIIDDAWLVDSHSSGNFSNSAPPHLSSMIYRHSSDYSYAIKNFPNRYTTRNWEEFSNVTKIKVQSHFSISRFDHKFADGDTSSGWIVHI